MQVEEKKELSSEEAYSNNQKATRFMQAFKKESDEFNSSPQMVYFIVSNKFIDDWISFHQSERDSLQPMNHDLLDQSDKLRRGLVEGQDFDILGNQSYKFLSGFKKAVELKRMAYKEGDEKKISIYSQKLLYIVLTKEKLVNFKSKNITPEKFAEEFQSTDMLGPKNTIKDFIHLIVTGDVSLHTFKGRVWVSDGQLSMKELLIRINSSSNRKISCVGKCIENEGLDWEQVALKQNSFVILECSKFNDWFISEGVVERCDGCYKVTELKFPCICKKVRYCTAVCQENNKKYHIKLCSMLQRQEFSKKIEMKPTHSSSSRSMRGLVGLSNLGNTCFMNSCLQCLSHTLPLTNYFLNGHYEEEINTGNVMGSKGRLAKNYANFIKNMWCESNSTYSPYQLKSAVASINPMFSGYGQQDSQQFLSSLVSGLSEDLSRIDKKPYLQNIQSNGRPDKQVALESWMRYIRREQSIIVDLMVGQYKSKVTCPDCKRESITFDPFSTLTLPIPEEAIPKELEYYVLFKNNQQETKLMSIIYRKADPESWLDSAVKKLGREKNQFKFYILTFFENIYSFENQSKAEIIYKYENEKKPVFLIELTPEEIQLENRVQIPINFTRLPKFGKQYQSLWFKRPFYFDLEDTNGLQIVQRILKHIYTDTYERSTRRFKGLSSQFPQSFEDYYLQMLQNRPFKLILKWKKELVRFHQKIKLAFKAESVFEDEMTLKEMLEDKEITDVELEVRFTEEGLKKFNFERMKNYTSEKSQKPIVNSDKKSVTLEQCFEVFEEPERLEKGNQWYCSKCKEHKLATKELTVYKAPEILILHLKRFKVKAGMRKEKNEATVIFPAVLNLQNYVADPSPPSSYIPDARERGYYKNPSYEAKMNGSLAPVYELYATSNHYGGLGGGHYTANGKNNEKWYTFNDSSVSSISEKEILSRGTAAYMLFYKRKD